MNRDLSLAMSSTFVISSRQQPGPDQRLNEFSASGRKWQPWRNPQTRTSSHKKGNEQFYEDFEGKNEAKCNYLVLLGKVVAKLRRNEAKVFKS